LVARKVLELPSGGRVSLDAHSARSAKESNTHGPLDLLKRRFFPKLDFLIELVPVSNISTHRVR
jgi:hypothetical protein